MVIEHNVAEMFQYIEYTDYTVLLILYLFQPSMFQCPISGWQN